jgi:hypothetical protein
LGFPTGRSFYFINYTPTSFLAPSNAIKLSSIITAPSRFHVAAAEKLHADKQLSGAIVRSVKKLASITF